MSDRPNTAIIEMSAVGKIKDALLRTECVEPDICENDKTPSWDGELRVYRKKSFEKSNLYGRIPVQIKGQWVSKIQSNTIKFSVDTVDMRNYFNDGGVIFFVAQVKDFDHYKIYYRSLLPFDLRKILVAAQAQKSKQITLQHFPNRHINGMLRILIDFLDNKKKQGQLLPNICSMQDLSASNMDIEKFEFSVPKIGLSSEKDLFNTLLNSPLYIYAKPKNIDASFVVDKILPKEIFIQKDTPIIANGELLFDGFSVVRASGKKNQIRIGSGISMEISDTTLHFNYTFEGTLQEQLAELKFLTAMMQGQPVQIGGYITEGKNPHLTGHTIEEIQNRLNGLLEIHNALCSLHVKKDLKLSDLSEDEFKMLNWLIIGMDGKLVPISINGGPGVGILTIANLKIMLCCKRNDVGEGFLISDFFASTGWQLVENEHSIKEGLPISPYVLMDCDTLKSIDNIDFENVVTSIHEYPFSVPYGEKIILFILELLKFYDSEGPKKSMVLDVANNLLDYLSEHNKEKQDLYKINRLQIIKRQRPLNAEEMQCLVSLKESGISPQFQLAANILLGSFQEANLIYDKLPKLEQQKFDEYPIVHLWDGHCRTIANNH